MNPGDLSNSVVANLVTAINDGNRAAFLAQLTRCGGSSCPATRSAASRPGRPDPPAGAYRCDTSTAW